MAKVKFEDALKGLEDIVERLEKGDLPLDETLFEYENGILRTKDFEIGSAQSDNSK